MKNNITDAAIINFFKRSVSTDPIQYDDCGEINATLLGENAQDFFSVMTEFGDTEIEQHIFDLSTKFCSENRINHFI